MRQAKRLFYIILLNIVISAITVAIVIQLWSRNHPEIIPVTTPLIILVTPKPPTTQPDASAHSPSGTSAPGATQAVITDSTQAIPTIKMINYQVKEGDTLGALAVEFNTTIEDIMSVNGLSDPDSLYVGQIITIPTGRLPTATLTDIPVTVESTHTPRPSATVTHGPSPTASPTQVLQEPQLIIESVIGAGVLENERVVLRRTGDGELSLAGWRISDGAGHEYIFPQLTLFKDSSINLNTRTGQDTVMDLYWDLTSPIWGSGRTVYLYDPEKTLRASFSIP